MERSDEELITAHLRGDERAFPALLDRYLGAVWSLAIRLAQSKEDADDIAQETFTKAWRNLPRFRPESASFRTWLLRIAHNAAVDLLRKRRALPLSRFEEDGKNPLLDELADEEPLQDERAALAEDAHKLEEALLKLPLPAREVLLLRYKEGLTFEEIGAVLREPLNTVKSRHRRALITLREMLRHQK